jgi:hypothetical protein
MPRGGFRPGSGPKKGTKYKTKKRLEEERQSEAKEKPPASLPEQPVLPLDYMLKVLNDPDTSPDRKDRMAALAAPFCHGRVEPIKANKKDEKAKKASDVAGGNRFGAAPPPKVVGRIG